MSGNISQATLTHGTVGGTPIVSTFDASGLASTRYVTLGSNYARVIAPGYPEPNAGSEHGKSATASPKTILAGARVLFFAHEAAALVAAGAGAYS
jgi:hypothetical protein